MKRHAAQGLWLSLIWFCLIRVGVTAESDPLNQRSQRDSAGTTPVLQVLIYNYAPVSNGDLKVAKEVATSIYEDVGIRTEWLDCYSAEGELNYNPDCGRLTPTTLVVRILPRSKAEGLKQPPSALGFAVLNDSGQLAHYASAFYHRVEELGGKWTCSRPVVLGHIMAHEIGHLLLGLRSHSRAGLMSASWDRAELERINQRALTFTFLQVKEIQARFLERHTSAEASRLGQVAEKRQVGDASN